MWASWKFSFWTPSSPKKKSQNCQVPVINRSRLGEELATIVRLMVLAEARTSAKHATRNEIFRLDAVTCPHCRLTTLSLSSAPPPSEGAIWVSNIGGVEGRVGGREPVTVVPVS